MNVMIWYSLNPRSELYFVIEKIAQKLYEFADIAWLFLKLQSIAQTSPLRDLQPPSLTSNTHKSPRTRFPHAISSWLNLSILLILGELLILSLSSKNLVQHTQFRKHSSSTQSPLLPGATISCVSLQDVIGEFMLVLLKGVPSIVFKSPNCNMNAFKAIKICLPRSSRTSSRKTHQPAWISSCRYYQRYADTIRRSNRLFQGLESKRRGALEDQWFPRICI